ncbi:hypothetical protein YPPY19_1300, partial [Yersinia pestis PY-19]
MTPTTPQRLEPLA